MANHDIRAYLGVLEKRGKLKRIQKEVDHTWEVSCIARWMFQALPEDKRFGLLFEAVKAYKIPVMTGILGASREVYAMALDTIPDKINETWVQALLNPVTPKQVEEAPCQETVHMGGDVDLRALPIPIWTPGKDAAPYITNPCITRDHDTGVQNVAVYRSMVKDKNHLVVNLSPGRHGTLCYESFKRKGQKAPFALVIGAEPVVHFSAVANLPYGRDELTVAGGLKGGPVEVVQAKTVDLLVPASAQFVIEGEIHPDEFAEEGPFGEFAGFMGPTAKRPLATITAITHTKDPVYYGYISQMPPSESTTIQSLSNAGLILKMLRHDIGHETVKDVHIDLTYGGMLAHGIISMVSRYPGHAKQVGRLVADTTTLKRVTVVDDDIDIRDAMHMDWAMNARFNPERDTIIIKDVFSSAAMDPTVQVCDGRMALSSKMVIDATEKQEGLKAISMPPKELMVKALDSWKEIGLPEFVIPKRTRYILGL
ncbi:UbiD family decarboxylase [bacterium]|nr:UbiD family decarboxylase [bacterium]